MWITSNDVMCERKNRTTTTPTTTKKKRVIASYICLSNDEAKNQNANQPNNLKNDVRWLVVIIYCPNYITVCECECVWIMAMSATINDNQAKIVWNLYTYETHENTKKNSLT